MPIHRSISIHTQEVINSLTNLEILILTLRIRFYLYIISMLFIQLMFNVYNYQNKVSF